MSKHTKGELSLNNYHYPYAYLVIREGRDDNDAFPRPRKICDVTLDGKTEEEYKANAERLVKCWNEYDKLKAKEQSHDDLLAACEAAIRIKRLWCPVDMIDNVDEGVALWTMHDKFEQAIAKAKE